MQAKDELKAVNLTYLRESKLNPRRVYNAMEMAELQASIQVSGVLTALLVRPHPKEKGCYEIAAGHRRFKAASRVESLESVPCVIREMSDQEFEEVINVENLQRADLHPMEEADGLAHLMKTLGFEPAALAARVGRTTRYVYDRMKLLNLSPDARKLFETGAFTAEHAIHLARLTKKDQARAIGTKSNEFRDGGLFIMENAPSAPDLGLEVDFPVKSVSVREFVSWINDNVRFEATEIDAELFPETAAAVVTVQEIAKEDKIPAKMVAITHDHFVRQDARDPKGGRTIGPRSWKRADGKEKSKTCEYSVMGVIAAGPGRGEAFWVCLAKKKCKVHWKAEQKETKERADAPDQAKRKAIEERQKKERDERDRRQAEERQRWQAARPEILKAIATKVMKLPAKVGGPVATVLMDTVRLDQRINMKLAKPKTSDEVIRYLAAICLANEMMEWNAMAVMPKLAKKIGVDIAKILKATKIEPVKEPEGHDPDA